MNDIRHLVLQTTKKAVLKSERSTVRRSTPSRIGFWALQRPTASRTPDGARRMPPHRDHVQLQRWRARSPCRRRRLPAFVSRSGRGTQRVAFSVMVRQTRFASRQRHRCMVMSLRRCPEQGQERFFRTSYRSRVDGHNTSEIMHCGLIVTASRLDAFASSCCCRSQR